MGSNKSFCIPTQNRHLIIDHYNRKTKQNNIHTYTKPTTNYWLLEQKNKAKQPTYIPIQNRQLIIDYHNRKTKQNKPLGWGSFRSSSPWFQRPEPLPRRCVRVAFSWTWWKSAAGTWRRAASWGSLIRTPVGEGGKGGSWRGEKGNPIFGSGRSLPHTPAVEAKMYALSIELSI